MALGSPCVHDSVYHCGSEQGSQLRIEAPRSVSYPGDIFWRFQGPSVCFPFIFDVFLVPFTAPGAHARMVLPLQRELDPEGLGRSENRCFFDVFSESKKKGIRGHPFLTFCDFMNPEGADWAPK